MCGQKAVGGGEWEKARVELQGGEFCIGGKC